MIEINLIRIRQRIDDLQQFVDLLELIGISKDFGSGLQDALKNEIHFLKQMQKVDENYKSTPY